MLPMTRRRDPLLSEPRLPLEVPELRYASTGVKDTRTARSKTRFVCLQYPPFSVPFPDEALTALSCAAAQARVEAPLPLGALAFYLLHPFPPLWVPDLELCDRRD